MFKIGDRVYDEFDMDLIGEVVETLGDKCYVKSVIDETVELVESYRLYEVGTGPAMEKPYGGLDIVEMFEDELEYYALQNMTLPYE